MDIKEYIDSGILELYATGALTEAEMAEVENICNLHPEIKAELTEIQSALESYAQFNAVEPVAELKNKILNSLEFKNDNNKKVKLTVEKNTNRFNPAIAASIVFCIISAGISLYLLNENIGNQRQIAILQKSVNDLRGQNDSIFAKLKIEQANYATMVNPMNKVVKLNPLKLNPDARAVVYYDSVNKTNYISTAGLPRLNASKQYQLWAIVEGKPVDLGVLPLNEINTLVKTTYITSAAAFAITIEPIGGSVSPTMDQMIVMGKVDF